MAGNIRVSWLLLASLTLLSPLISTVCAYKSYKGYQVLRTPVINATSIVKLLPLMKRPELDFWRPPHIGLPSDIMVNGDGVPALTATLTDIGLPPSIMIADVGVLVEKEREAIIGFRGTSKTPALDRFLTFDEIMSYLHEVATMYPEIATLTEIGLSYENRSLSVLRLSNGPNKNAMFMDAMIHAREWIGAPVVLYAINELTENLANNQEMLDKNDFYFLVVTNPDGYDYSWNEDRFWRKTRKPTQNHLCVGTDANRNFDYAWAEDGQGLECSITYAGDSVFSEPETKAMADFISATPNITMGVSIHSCGQYFLYSWGASTLVPPTAERLNSVATEAADALASVRGTEYSIGSISHLLYMAYGVTTDWYYGRLGVPLAYTIELPCGGFGGFNPPPTDIEPVATETWEAIKVLASYV